MTLNQLNYFQKIAEVGNMGRAAQLLHISQPSLSISITNLEKELNLMLFNRTGHKLKLTAEGEQLLVHARTILAEAQETQLHMQSLSANRETHIRIGCIAPVLFDKLPRLVREFISMQPDNHLKIDLNTDNTPQLISMLREGYYDFAICSSSSEHDIDQKEIAVEPYMLICPPGGEIPRTWDELLTKDLIGFHPRAASYHEIQAMLLERGIEPVYTHRAPDEESIAALVSNGFGYGIAAQVSILKNYNVTVAPLPSPNEGMVRRLYITKLINRPPVGASSRFYSYVEKMYGEADPESD